MTGPRSNKRSASKTAKKKSRSRSRSTSKSPKKATRKAPSARTNALRDLAALKREENYSAKNKRLKQEGKPTRKAPAISARLRVCGLIGLGIDKKKWIVKPNGPNRKVWRNYTGALKPGQLDRGACRAGGARNADGANKKEDEKKGGASKRKDLGYVGSKIRSKNEMVHRLKACKLGSIVMINGREYRVVKSIVAI